MLRRPFHPVLFAAFPVLFLFTQNAHLVRVGKIALPLAVIVSGTVLLALLSSLVLRDLRRGALAASGLALLGLSYGHFLAATKGRSFAGVVVGRDLVLLPGWGVLGAIVVAFAWRVRSVSEMTRIFNAVALGLVVFSLVNVGTAIAGQEGRPLQSRAGEESEPIPVADRGTKRDIYYLVFDRYGSAPVLENYLHFDNSEFLGELRERGFYVADESLSNYPTTAHSLASSLNMEYLDGLASVPGKGSEDWRPLYKRIVNPKVTRFLKREGYRYAHIGPWYDPTAHDPSAHVNYHYDRRSEFTRVLLKTTVLHPIASRVGFLKELDGRTTSHNQIRFQFDSMVDAARPDVSTFVFAHVLMPHEPFTFSADGDYVPEDEERRMSYEEAFTAQLRFTNKKILETVDRLLAGPGDEDPIIILQADEGPKLIEWGYGGKDRWSRASDAELAFKTGILNAYHLPGVKEADLYPSITPVNTFRKVLNLYFGTDLDMLEDRIYVYGNEDEPYVFTDITERVRGAGPPLSEISPPPRKATASAR